MVCICICVWVSMCLVFFGVFGWIPMAPELRIAWSPMAPELRIAWSPMALELRIAWSPMASELGIALKKQVFGNYTFLRFLTHNRALNFLETAYCRELRYGTLCFGQHRLKS